MPIHRKTPLTINNDKSQEKFNKLKNKEKLSIKNTLKKFIDNKPFASYSYPNPMTYLNQKRWVDFEDEKPQDEKSPVEVVDGVFNFGYMPK